MQKTTKKGGVQGKYWRSQQDCKGWYISICFAVVSGSVPALWLCGWQPDMSELAWKGLLKDTGHGELSLGGKNCIPIHTSTSQLLVYLWKQTKRATSKCYKTPRAGAIKCLLILMRLQSEMIFCCIIDGGWKNKCWRQVYERLKPLIEVQAHLQAFTANPMDACTLLMFWWRKIDSQRAKEAGTQNVTAMFACFYFTHGSLMQTIVQVLFTLTLSMCAFVSPSGPKIPAICNSCKPNASNWQATSNSK